MRPECHVSPQPHPLYSYQTAAIQIAATLSQNLTNKFIQCWQLLKNNNQILITPIKNKQHSYSTRFPTTQSYLHQRNKSATKQSEKLSSSKHSKSPYDNSSSSLQSKEKIMLSILQKLQSKPHPNYQTYILTSQLLKISSAIHQLQFTLKENQRQLIKTLSVSGQRIKHVSSHSIPNEELISSLSSMKRQIENLKKNITAAKKKGGLVSEQILMELWKR